jgi:hypothetical protein
MTRPTLGSERGVALLAALLLSLILSALASAMAVSSQTDVLLVRNHQRAAEARAAADAGLSQATQLVLRRLNLWQANGFPNASAAISALLQGPDGAFHPLASHPWNDDNGSLEDLEIAGETELPRFPALVIIPAMVGSSYQARILDDDDPTLSLSAADIVRIGENTLGQTDLNRRTVIQATGFAMDNTVVRLEATLGIIALPAVVSDQSITVFGNASVNGSAGGVHSNSDLELQGSPSIAQDATATGTVTVTGSPDVDGVAAGSRAPIPIPAVNAIDYRGIADFVLGVGPVTGGRVYGPFLPDGSLGPMLCPAPVICEAVFGWTYEPANNGWRVNGNALLNGTYYVQGNAVISGNPGNIGPPKHISIIAEGSIDITGTPQFIPETAGIMFVTSQDLRITGNMEMTGNVEARILVREQMELRGNPILNAQIMVDNAANVSTLVTNTSIGGNVTINYNGSLGEIGFGVTSWRETR